MFELVYENPIISVNVVIVLVMVIMLITSAVILNKSKKHNKPMPKQWNNIYIASIVILCLYIVALFLFFTSKHNLVFMPIMF